MSQYKAIIINGPTASGKTKLVMELYDKINCELISMDSVQLYQEFNIGSAKPSLQELKKYPHYLIDEIILPQVFTVTDYHQAVVNLIQSICDRGKIPVIVGGTMLYLRSLVENNVAQVPKVDLLEHDALYQKFNEMSQVSRYQLLKEIDSNWACKIHENDIQRTIRGLMVYYVHGKPMSNNLSDTNPNNDKLIDYKIISITCEDRDSIRDIIKQRTDTMIYQGLVDEVRVLRNKFSNYVNHPAFKSIGYQQVGDYLNGSIDIDDLKSKINIATSQLVKRQSTWQRRFNADISVDMHALNSMYKRQIVNFILEFNECI